MKYMFFIVIFIAAIYYGALLYFSKQIGKWINSRRANLEMRAKINNTDKIKWDKSIEHRKRVVKISLSVMSISQYFILGMLFIGSYFEIGKLIFIYKETGSIIFVDNLRSVLVLIITVFYLVYVVKGIFQKKEKDVI